uniref:Basement membrane proteoglycan n=1 Tax=Panagrellus redivivus TaxID=6233 RepID=A0A7E4VZA7_PANRE
MLLRRLSLCLLALGLLVGPIEGLRHHKSRDVSHLSDADDLQITVYPHEHTVREGRDASFECRARTADNGVYPQVRWTRVGGPLPEGAHESGGRLSFASVGAADGGRYVCIAQHNGRVAEAYAILNVNSYGPQELAQALPQGHGGSCMSDERACGSNECVKSDYVCDGEPDCRDQSDEQNCPAKRICEPNEFRCNNDRCIQKMWLCDGDDDCGDNSDELNCGERKPGDLCQPTEFRCRDGRQCVPQSFQCDGTNDCQDGSDEVGCVQPTVVEPPDSNRQVPQGDTFQLTCRAVAVPEPYINWRLNWGPVCEPPRCVQESEGGVGTLTVHNAQPMDQGAYTCEAINVKGRVLATPDCIVRIVSIPNPPPPTRPPPPPAAPQIRCDPTGSTAPSADASRGCPCKPLVTGPNCDQCRPGSFHLNNKSPTGCLKCFCFGITDQCRSSDWYRTQDAACEKLFFNGDSEGVILTNLAGTPTEANFEYNLPSYLTNSEPHRETLYWNLPLRFKGDKVSAYGGEMSFQLQFSGNGPVLNEPLVVLKGNGITLVHRKKDQYGLFQPDRPVLVTVETYETNYERENGTPATREDLLMVLADLDAFQIRATHVSNQISTSLGDVSWEIAVNRDTQGERALEVEQCSCPPGYVGLSCEDCAPGYERSGHGPYLGTCVPVRSTPPPQRACPPGAISPIAGYDGSCECKPNLSGPNCDQCAASTFNYKPQSPQGCLKCFCSGVTNQCRSSSYRRAETSIDYRRGDQDQLEISIADVNSPWTPQTQPDVYDRAINFGRFDEARGQTLYWKLPAKFLGDKVTSYGGKLSYTFKYSGNGNQNNGDADVILKGNEITIQHRYRGQLRADTDNVVEIPITEEHWERNDGQPVTREHLLMALADLDTALIKLSYLDDCATSSLISVTLEHAEPYGHGGVAADVEHCSCPEGYVGTSCEDCAPGYRRTGGGLYLGLCERCECNGHATSCDTEYGHCLNCQHNTEGDQCERCAPGFEGDARRGTPHDCRAVATKPPCDCNNHSPRGCDSYGRCLLCEHNTEGYHCESCKRGYYGDATRGSPYDCTPCPCPGSSDCFVGPDGQVKCRNCPAGYSGDRCTECAPGYTPSANTGGRECEPIGRVNPNDITFVEKPKAQLRVQIYPPQHLAIKQGSRAKWTCVAQGYRPEEVTIQWSKVGSNTLPPHVRQIGNQLLIESVTPEDIGQYRCTGTVADNIATDEGSLQVESGTPPTPIVTPPFQSVPENGRAVFECIVPGYTSCEISWHKDEIGNPLPYGVRKTGNKIIIHSANREHVGNYYCTVRTPYGPGKSNPGRLEVERKQWRPETDPPSLDVEVGNPARFHCFVRGVPHAIFEWRREDGAPLDSNVDQAGGYLTVLSAQQHHSGRYICAAQDPQDPNQGPIDAPPVQLNVRDRPAPPVAPPAPPARAPIAPQVDPIQQTVDQGTPAQFRCWVEGNPSAQVRWTAAGNRPLPQGARDDRGTLVFSSVTQNDAGEYICSAYDPETRNYVPSQPARLDVRQPSHPPQVDPPEQTVDENTPSAIRCWVPGNPAARLSWARRGGAPLPPDARDDGRGNLNIAETKTLHEGDYECTAVDPNTNVPQTSQPARINVRIAEPQVVHPDTGSPPHPVATPPVITVKKGEPARFHCDARSETPADIHWTYGPDRGPLRGDAYQEGDDIVIDSSDDTNAGEYHCTATNAYGTGNAEPVRLVVTDNEEPPTARVEPRVFNGKPGDRHQFKCHTTGIPPPQVSWTGPNDGPLPAGATDLGDGVLDIVDARKDHEGDYTCHAVNIVGEAEDHGSVHIGPSLTVRTDPAGPRIVLTVGEPLEIKCEAVGDPDPDVEWLHDPGPERGDLPDDFQPVTISEQYLRHPHIGLLNAGKYTCRGSNEHASATKDIYIEVVEPSHVATVSILGGNHQWFALDQPNQLVCASTGQSLVDKVEWVKVDDSLPSDIEDHNEQGLLHFGTFKPDYAGEYECRGFRKNELIGSAKVNIHAEGSSSSHDIARVDISPPTIRVVNEGDSIILDCNVRGRKNPTSLTWKHYAKLPKKSHYRQSKITIHTPDALGGHKRKRPIELEDANGSGKYLQIRGARLIDAGLYTVIANMSDGTALVAAPSWLVVKPRGHEGEVTYQWDLARGGNLVRQLGDQQELSIKSADPSQDYGVYRCTVEDADGNTVGTAFSAVSVGFSSNEKAEEAKFEETSDAELVCPVYAVPGSTIIWRREGDSDLPSNAEPRGNKLLITEFDESSAGLYTCTMQIDQFTVEGHVNAQILVPDTTIKVDINVSNENVAVGDRVWLDCIVVGDPEASIEYEKEGSDELPAGAQVTGKRLLFNTVSEEDTGTYICKADTTEGRLIATAKINVGSTKRKRKHSNRARRRHNRRSRKHEGSDAAAGKDKASDKVKRRVHHRDLTQHHRNSVFGDWFASA